MYSAYLIWPALSADLGKLVPHSKLGNPATLFPHWRPQHHVTGIAELSHVGKDESSDMPWAAVGQYHLGSGENVTWLNECGVLPSLFQAMIRCTRGRDHFQASEPEGEVRSSCMKRANFCCDDAGFTTGLFEAPTA
jgi:hypothetical protein